MPVTGSKVWVGRHTVIEESRVQQKNLKVHTGQESQSKCCTRTADRWLPALQTRTNEQNIPNHHDYTSQKYQVSWTLTSYSLRKYSYSQGQRENPKPCASYAR